MHIMTHFEGSSQGVNIKASWLIKASDLSRSLRHKRLHIRGSEGKSAYSTAGKKVSFLGEVFSVTCLYIVDTFKIFYLQLSLKVSGTI